MADWSDSNPTLSTSYVTVLTALRDRDKDAGSLFFNAPTNPQDRLFRYNRSTDVFEEYQTSDASWHPKTLGVAGGGTGATTASGARTNLGLGTMAIQAANAVAITGGTISGLSSLAVSGAVTLSGGLTANGVGIIGGDGRIPIISSTYFANLGGGNLVGLPAPQLSGLVPDSCLGSGTPNASTFLRGDRTWASPAGVLPSGLIAIFDTTCPGGWTRVAAFDNLFIRGAASYGATGGADTHSHAINAVGAHQHSASYTTDDAYIDHAHHFSTTSGNSTQTAGASYALGGLSLTFPQDTHLHPVAGDTGAMSQNAFHHHTGALSTSADGAHTHTEAAASNVPAFINVVFCKKD